LHTNLVDKKMTSHFGSYGFNTIQGIRARVRIRESRFLWNYSKHIWVIDLTDQMFILIDEK